jgi:hypothetical protein
LKGRFARAATFETVLASDFAAFLTEPNVQDVIEAIEEAGELGNVKDGEGDRRGIGLHWSYQLSPAPLYTPSVDEIYLPMCIFISALFVTAKNIKKYQNNKRSKANNEMMVITTQG